MTLPRPVPPCPALPRPTLPIPTPPRPALTLAAASSASLFLRSSSALPLRMRSSRRMRRVSSSELDSAAANSVRSHGVVQLQARELNVRDSAISGARSICVQNVSRHFYGGNWGAFTGRGTRTSIPENKNCSVLEMFL